jgi:hypothetical protein
MKETDEYGGEPSFSDDEATFESNPMDCQCGHSRGDHEGMGPSRGRPVFSACGRCKCNQWRPVRSSQEIAKYKSEPPYSLKQIADTVLAYRPKSRQPKPKKRKKAKVKS